MRRLAVALTALGFLWAGTATLYLLSAAGPDGIGTSAAVAPDVTSVGHLPVSLASENGPWMVGLLLGVTLLAGLPFGVALASPPEQRMIAWTSGALLLAFSVTAGFSVGLPYILPALVLLASASVTPPGRRVTQAATDPSGRPS